MSIILSKSLFVHIPKTGGTWIIEAIRNANLIKFETKKNTKHASYHELIPFYDNIRHLGVFTFVRNPVTWWQSRWSDRFQREYFSNIDSRPPIDKWCGNIKWYHNELFFKNKNQFDNFNIYIESILKRRPGFYSEYLRFMTNVKKLEIGKYERIVDDLIEILYRVGEDFDIDKIRNTPKANESDLNLKSMRFYTEKNLKNLIESEKRVMDIYDYSTELDDYADLISE